ncbi:putative O-glycosylation ligase, exosortase A system-associated [Hyphococcus luteus]|uniref:Putative O-glycosylation ligase, exosortase A system-associated n=1 Tax=Hyphococcus luteus TaxID=2058213 RepID=A0A2S7K2R2_9PROT|nr:putative O-glycosylation ligase, exosortase A system-associated [Marinicaulis flavus]PQA86794.1 putative O-glycosylation ligase, exosortase A system-associated [Marinicaulis flavus]
MRDIILLSFTAICLIAALRHPFAGLLTWAWFTLLTPHQAAYGVYGIPLNVVIAGVTMAAYVLSGEIAKFRFDPITSLIVLFAGWLTVAQAFSLDPENSALYYDRFIKTLLFIVLCAQMAAGKLRFNALVWTVVACIGFLAAKGALFTFATLGQYHVQGLPNTVLEDNNHFGIAVASILPLILYLRAEAAKPVVRQGLLVLFGLSIVAIIGTQSRGAFLALIAFSGYFWIRAKHKFAILGGLALIMIPTIAFMPSKWTERMSTISEATEDASFMGRVDAWVINTKLAAENPLTGAGLRNSYQKEIAQKVDIERAETAKAAHSIYFEVLGGAGFVGLALYLTLFATAFFSAWRIYLSRANDRLAPWKWRFAYYAQMSILVFAVGGASVSLEMWDGYLIVIALVAALTKMAVAEEKPEGHALAAARLHNWRGRKRLKEILEKPA